MCLSLPPLTFFVTLEIKPLSSNVFIEREIVLSLTPNISANDLSLIKQLPVVLLYSITYARTKISVGFNPNLNKSLLTPKNTFVICHTSDYLLFAILANATKKSGVSANTQQLKPGLFGLASILTTGKPYLINWQATQRV
jgi:hypothetical protein